MAGLAGRLRRVLAVEPGEGQVVLRAAAALFLVEWASVAVSNASDAMFLKRVGIDWLPLVFLFNSVLLTGTTFVVGRRSARGDKRRLLPRAFVSLAGVLLLLWAAAASGAPGIATVLVLASKQIDVIALLVFWLVLGSLMSGRQSKRLVAPMTAGGTVGTIAGSFTSGPIGHALGVPALLAIAAAAFVAAAAVAASLVAHAAPRFAQAGSRIQPSSAATARFPDLWAGSALFRTLCTTSFLAGLLGPVLYYEFSFAADAATRTADGEQELLALYGLLRGWINVGVLGLQLGVSSRLFHRIGVPLAATLAPVAYLAGLGGLGLRFGLPTAMPATIGAGVLDNTVHDPAQRVLIGLLPRETRPAAGAVVAGPAKRLGGAAGCLLILAVMTAGDPRLLALAALPAAALWLAVALHLWRRYPNLLLEAARVRGDAAEDRELDVLDAATLRSLEKHLVGEDQELLDGACELFREAPRDVSVGALVRSLGLAPPASRPRLLATLDAVLDQAALDLVPDGALAAQIARLLERQGDFDATARGSLLHALGRLAPGADEFRVAIDFEGLSRSEQALLQLADRVAWARRSGDQVGLADALATALGSDDAACRGVALRELRCALRCAEPSTPCWQRLLSLLVSALDCKDEPASLRARAAAAIADVARLHPDAMQEAEAAVLSLADDRDAAVRAAVLRYVGAVGLSAHGGLVASRLSSRDDDEFEAAAEALARLGASAVEGLLEALRCGNRRARLVAADLLREAATDRAALGSLADREVAQCRQLAMILGVFDASLPSGLVQARVRERIEEKLRLVLDLVAASRDDERIARVGASLGRGWNMRDRSVLLEALDAMLPAELAAQVLPLLEDRPPQRAAVDAAIALGLPMPTLEEALALAVAGGDPLTDALLASTVDAGLLRRAPPRLDADAALRVLSGGQGPHRDDEAGAVADPSMLTPVETMLHLRSLDLFDGLTTRQLSELASVVREVSVADGVSVVREGEYDDSMYFIVSGEVCIAKGGRPVARLGPRDFFGEMAVFDGEKRSATASAIGPCRLLRLARGDLFQVMEDQPDIGIGICQTLVRRVRGLLDERS